MDTRALSSLIRSAVEPLGALLDDVVLIGGSIMPLLHDEPSGIPLRPTEDVDAVIRTRTASSWQTIADALRARKFTEPMDAPHSDRWMSPSGVPLDLVPLHEDAGHDKPWQRYLFASALPLDGGTPIVRIASAPAVLLLKWRAWQARGEGDWMASADIEDVLGLLAMRSSLLDEVRQAPSEVRAELATFATTILAQPTMDDLVAGHVASAYDPASARRRATATLQALATFHA